MRRTLTIHMPRAGGGVTAPGRRERAEGPFYERCKLLPGRCRDVCFSAMIDSHASGGEGCGGERGAEVVRGGARWKANVDIGP